MIKEIMIKTLIDKLIIKTDDDSIKWQIQIQPGRFTEKELIATNGIKNYTFIFICDDYGKINNINLYIKNQDIDIDINLLNDYKDISLKQLFNSINEQYLNNPERQFCKFVKTI